LQQRQAVPRLAYRLFLFATLFTWPLLFVGGLVTTYRVGMAVPDWPTTFGINMFLYNFFNAAWGVFIEHGHRLYGAAVGLCLLIVVPWIQMIRSVPVSFKRFAWLALAGVIFQGILGGYRVRLNSTQLAMFHGAFAQFFFLYLCLLTSWLGRTRLKLSDTEHHLIPADVRNFSVGLVPLVYTQVAAGGWLRHFPGLQPLYLHEFLGFSVVVLLTIYSIKLKKTSLVSVPSFRRTRVLLVSLAHLQWLFGVGAWWLLRPFNGIPKPVTDVQALVRTFHQANGALVLGLTGVMALWVMTAYSTARNVEKSSATTREVVCLS
jgi:cytochrome c oxidase assembly protein subunit 15